MMIAILVLVVIVGYMLWYILNRQPDAGLGENDRGRIAELVETKAGEMQSKATDQVLKIAKDRLKTESDGVKEELARVTRMVERIDKERGKSITELATSVKHTVDATKDLESTTAQLNKALAGGQARGQWGERMAEDVLRVAGFIEGVQYKKRKKIESGSIPDFTFLLPQKHVLHMDVKFPLNNFSKYLEVDSESEKEAAAKQFLADARSRVQEVVTRDYVDPGGGTLDYMIVFIPNEQVYGFIQEKDPQLLDHALANKIVLCSPLTLFAILAVIRQSVDNFHLSEQTNEILKVMGDFNKQWDMYKDGMKDVGKHLDKARDSYDKFVDTRTRMLDVKVRKVKELRTKTGLDEKAELGAPATTDSKSSASEAE